MNKEIIYSRESKFDPLNHYFIMVENDIAVLGYDQDALKNKYALFPKNSDGEIISDPVFSFYADTINDLQLNDVFSLEELLGIDPTIQTNDYLSYSDCPEEEVEDD